MRRCWALPDRRVRIFADETLGRQIYSIRSEHGFTHWFEDADANRFGEYGILTTQTGKFISVGTKPRYRFVTESEIVDTMDLLVPSLPILNGLIGTFIKPRWRVEDLETGKPIATIIKQRMMIDVRHSLYAIEPIEGRELECLLLGAIVYALLDQIFK